jgi:hypothetical protein
VRAVAAAGGGKRPGTHRRPVIGGR